MNIEEKNSFGFINNEKYIIKYYKILLLLFIFFVKIYYNIIINYYISEINKNYSSIQNDLNLNFIINLNKKINLGIYSFCLKNGGRARLTSILINYLNKIKLFKIYLFTKVNKEDNEYLVPETIKRLVIKNNIKKMISKYKIGILIYNLNNNIEMNILNNLVSPKTIYYQHSSFFYLLYSNYSLFLSIYKEYQNSKYVVSLIPLESNYIFKYWGISSILMKSFVTYEYNSIIPSNLMSKTILMIGRSNIKYKRFKLGINAMEYIIKDNSMCEMKIISSINNSYYIQNLVENLNLENYIKLVGYTLTPEIHFENASLHIFPSMSESFGLVLSETKTYGIPNILVGLDYVQISKGGTIIIYDESAESIAKESIKLLNNKDNRKYLGREARKSMKKYNNQLLFYEWVKLILSVHNGEFYYNMIKNQEKLKDENELNKLLINQIELLKKRNIKFYNISIKDFQNFYNLYKFKI